MHSTAKAMAAFSYQQHQPQEMQGTGCMLPWWESQSRMQFQGCRLAASWVHPLRNPGTPHFPYRAVPADAEQGKTQVRHRCPSFPSWSHSIPAEATFYANQSPHPLRQAWFQLLLMCHLHRGAATLQSVYLDFTQQSFGACNIAD